MRKYLVPIALFLIAMPAAADAPSDQYDSFDRQNDTLRDNKTGLTWDRRLDPQRSRVVTVTGNYTQAETGCTILQVGGKTGRVPSIKELLTLFDEEPHAEANGSGNSAKYIDSRAFPLFRVDVLYFSSTAVDATNVWTLNFQTGEMKPSAKTDTGAVLCTF